MSTFVLTPKAKADLGGIWEYTETTWGTKQAETYVRLIERAIESVANDSRRGSPCDDIRAGYRRLAVGSHTLYFREGDDGITVVRILHQRMDPQRHL